MNLTALVVHASHCEFIILCKVITKFTQPMNAAATGRKPIPVPDDQTFEHVFDDLRKIIDQKHDNLVKMEQFLERMSNNEDLFDTEDQVKVRTTYQARVEEYKTMIEEFQVDMELYKDRVSDLEAKIAKRQQVLESIDAEVGAISSEPSLAEHFVKKQALLVSNFRSAKTMLCTSIKEKLIRSNKPMPA